MVGDDGVYGVAVDEKDLTADDWSFVEEEYFYVFVDMWIFVLFELQLFIDLRLSPANNVQFFVFVSFKNESGVSPEGFVCEVVGEFLEPVFFAVGVDAGVVVVEHLGE